MLASVNNPQEKNPICTLICMNTYAKLYHRNVFVAELSLLL